MWLKAYIELWEFVFNRIRTLSRCWSRRLESVADGENWGEGQGFSHDPNVGASVVACLAVEGAPTGLVAIKGEMAWSKSTQWKQIHLESLTLDDTERVQGKDEIIYAICWIIHFILNMALICWKFY